MKRDSKLTCGPLYIKRLAKNLIVPEYNREESSSLTLRAINFETIHEGGTVEVKLGFAMQLQLGQFGMITPVNSMLKRGLFVYRENIDEDFDDEVSIYIHNSSKMAQFIQEREVVGYLTIVGSCRKKIEIVEGF